MDFISLSLTRCNPRPLGHFYSVHLLSGAGTGEQNPTHAHTYTATILLLMHVALGWGGWAVSLSVPRQGCCQALGNAGLCCSPPWTHLAELQSVFPPLLLTGFLCFVRSRAFFTESLISHLLFKLSLTSSNSAISLLCSVFYFYLFFFFF